MNPRFAGCALLVVAATPAFAQEMLGDGLIEIIAP